MDRMGEWFFAIAMKPCLDCADGRRGVIMIGRGDHNGVGLVGFLCDHLAIITIGLGGGEFFGSLTQVFGIDIAQPNDVFTVQVQQ